MDSPRDIVYKRAFDRLARRGAQVAQLVEHVTENHGVGGSIPPLGTIPCFPSIPPRRTSYALVAIKH